MHNSQVTGWLTKWFAINLFKVRQSLAHSLQCNAFVGCDEFKRVFEECPRLARYFG